MKAIAKRVLFTLLTMVLFSAAIFAGVSAKAAEYSDPVESLVFSSCVGYTRVWDTNGPCVGDLVIPDYYCGLPVEIIWTGALNYTRITSVVIPDTVTSLMSGYNFDGCRQMKSVVMSENVSIIPDRAFSNCDVLESVDLGQGVTEIQYQAFGNCPKLEYIELPYGITEICADAFYNHMLSSYGRGLQCAYYPGTSAQWERVTVDDSTVKECILYETRVKSVASDTNGIKVTADERPGAKQYTFYRQEKINGQWTEWSLVNTTTAATCTDTKAVTGHTYRYAVQASNGPFTTRLSDSSKEITCAKVGSIKLSASSYVYDGKVKVPSVVVKDSLGKTLTKDVDYTVTYASGRKNVGTYNVTVTMKGNFTGKKTLSFKILPQTPTVTAVGTTAGNKLTWNKITGATAYDVYCRFYKNGAWSAWSKLGSTTATTYTHTKAATGYYYQYTVVAYNGSLRSSSKASGNAVRLAQPNVSAVGTTAGNKLTWNKITGAKGYDVYCRFYKNGAWSAWSKLGSTTATSYNHNKAATGYYYRYAVIAYSGTSKSALKESGNAVRLAQPNITATGTTAGNKLTWNKITGAKSYDVYGRFYKNGTWSAWSKLGSTTATSYTHTKAATGYYYRYAVIACSGTSKSALNESGTAVRLAPPKVTTVKTGAVLKSTWGKSVGAKSYNVCRQQYNPTTKKWSSWTKLASVTTLSYTDKTAKAGIYYRYTVLACSDVSRSSYTAGNSVKR